MIDFWDQDSGKQIKMIRIMIQNALQQKWTFFYCGLNKLEQNSFKRTSESNILSLILIFVLKMTAYI